MQTWRLGIALLGLLALFSLRADAPFTADFEGPLDPERWVTTKEGDFEEYAVEIAPAEGEQTGRLRLRAATRGCTDPMKFLGVRSVPLLPLAEGLDVGFDLDWNDQANGCYLSAGVFLCPEAAENPKAADNWVCLEYTGVPPGRTVRTNLWARRHGRLTQVYTDWGPRDERDRPLGRPLAAGARRLRLVVTPQTVQAFDGDEEIVPVTEYECGFDEAHLYLQMSSGTNYPAREVFFDNIVARPAAMD